MLKHSLLAVASTACAAFAQPTIINSFPHNGPFAGGVAYDPIADEIVVADQTAKTITFYDRATGAQKTQIPSPNTLPVGVKVNAATGNLWVVDEAEIVYEIDRAGVVVQSWSTRPTIIDASAIAIDPVDGNVWISNDSANIMAEFTSTGAPTGVQFTAPSSTDGDGLAYDPYNRVFYLGEDTANQILVIDRSGTLLNTIPVATQISPEGVDVDMVTGSVFVGNGFTAPPTIYELGGIANPPPANAVTEYGQSCSGGRLDVSSALRDDGVTPMGFWVGYQSPRSPGGTVLINIGLMRTQLPLTVIGSQCLAYALPELTGVVGTTNSNGRFGFDLAIPPGIPPGATIMLWGADVDLASLTIPSASGGVETVMQ